LDGTKNARRGEDGKLKAEPVGEQNVPAQVTETYHPGKTAKAAASKTNPGAVARGDKLAQQVGIGWTCTKWL
jgi:hypothetical protein